MTAIDVLTTLTASQNHLYVRWHEPGVAEVVLANPERRNAMSGPMTEAWNATMRALREIADSPPAASNRDEPEFSDKTGQMPLPGGLRAVVIRGEGSAFCAGGDLGWLADDQGASVSQLSERMDAFYAAWLQVVELPVPTVAYIDGPAVGAGAAVALACDIRWVGPGARFSVPFTRLGLHPGMGTTYLLTSAVGPAMARDLLLTSRMIDADEMLACGAATARVVPEDLLDRVRDIAVNAPIATRLTKRGFQPTAPASLAEAVRFEGLAQPVTMATRDVQEGLAAAQQRRAPRFENR